MVYIKLIYDFCRRIGYYHKFTLHTGHIQKWIILSSEPFKFLWKNFISYSTINTDIYEKLKTGK